MICPQPAETAIGIALLPEWVRNKAAVTTDMRSLANFLKIPCKLQCIEFRNFANTNWNGRARPLNLQ